MNREAADERCGICWSRSPQESPTRIETSEFPSELHAERSVNRRQNLDANRRDLVLMRLRVQLPADCLFELCGSTKCLQRNWKVLNASGCSAPTNLVDKKTNPLCTPMSAFHCESKSADLLFPDREYGWSPKKVVFGRTRKMPKFVHPFTTPGRRG
jgi:hypothetical protein